MNLISVTIILPKKKQKWKQELKSSDTLEWQNQKNKFHLNYKTKLVYWKTNISTKKIEQSYSNTFEKYIADALSITNSQNEIHLRNFVMS